MSSPDLKFEVVPSKKGAPGLVYYRSDGERRVIHSLYDPVSEGRSFAEKISSPEKSIILLLGIGLGYHVRAVSEKFPECKVFAVECVEGAEKVRDAGDASLCSLDNLTILDEVDCERVIDIVVAERVRMGYPPVLVIAYQPLYSLSSGKWDPVKNYFERRGRLNIREKLLYKKFSDDCSTVLLLDFPYFLISEIKKNLKRLGHKVVSVPCDENRTPAQVIARVVKAVVEHKPDFLLSVNHLGFDEGGELTRFLEAIDLPAVVWYVDSPEVIVAPYKDNVSDRIFIFVWDYSYVRFMRKAGYSNVDYLPLGTDETIFRRRSVDSALIESGSSRVGFVGNSMCFGVSKALAKLPPDAAPVVERGAGEFLEIFRGTPVRVGEAVRKLSREVSNFYEALQDHEKAHFKAALMWRATQMYRMRCIEGLREFSPVIHGDTGWRNLFNGGLSLRNPLHYYRELPLFYQTCQVNLNMTSLQMPVGVNQRVFDVPACGGFIVTDYREGIEELFKVGVETIVYGYPEELREVVGFYLKNRHRAEEVAKRGRERVLRDHTYTVRLERILEKVRGEKKVQ